MFGFVALFIVGVFILIISKVIKEWSYNRSQPKISVAAKVVTKRTDYSNNHSSDEIHQSFTWYYITFEFTTGDRKEFLVNAASYGMLVSNDQGMLTFQGNKYINFERV